MDVGKVEEKDEDKKSEKGEDGVSKDYERKV